MAGAYVGVGRWTAWTMVVLPGLGHEWSTMRERETQPNNKQNHRGCGSMWSSVWWRACVAIAAPRRGYWSSREKGGTPCSP
jgi:hypothetical protein